MKTNKQTTQNTKHKTHTHTHTHTPINTHAYYNCSIFGVLVFLRQGWIVGQAGVIQSLGIILACLTVTSITALSCCAVATNGRVQAGGAYFMISRSLGPQFGGTVGTLFGIGNAIATSMYLVGFAETLTDVVGNNMITIFFFYCDYAPPKKKIINTLFLFLCSKFKRQHYNW